jgi:hypothetical protein
MTSTPTSFPKWKPRWWLWPLVPFAFIVGVVGLLFFSMMVIVVAPFEMIVGWRQERRETRKLRDDGRLISLTNAIDQFSLGNREFIAEFGKGIGRIWLVCVRPSDREMFAALPKYATLKSDPRGTLMALEKIDKATVSGLISYLQNAALVTISSKELTDLPEEIRDSMRVVCMWDELSPSRQLSEQTSK